MKFFLSLDEISLLNLMLLSPNPVRGNEKSFSPYNVDASKEADAKNYLRLKKWFMKTILEPAVGEDGKVVAGAFRSPKDGKWTSLQEGLVDKLKEIVKHYDKAYCVIPIAETYVMLLHKLNNKGKELELEDDFSDPNDKTP